MLIPLMLAALLDTTGSHDIAGVKALWASRQTRYVFVGELHGTRETPALFADIIYQARKSGRPILVAVEQPATEQQAIDGFEASDGGSAARSKFLAEPMWRGTDGRGSRAYFALFETLRQYRRRGLIQSVVAIQSPPANLKPGEGMNAQINRGMAEIIRSKSEKIPGALTLVYSGSVHANTATVNFGDGPFQPAAALLPRSETISLLVESDGGSAWNCQNDICSAHPVSPSQHHQRAILLRSDRQGYDGVAYVGLVTASPPANASR